MSLAAKLTLATSCIASTGIIGYVHIKQQTDRWKISPSLHFGGENFHRFDTTPGNHIPVPERTIAVVYQYDQVGVVSQGVHYDSLLQFMLDKLHEGVVKDVERRQRRKAENIYLLERQKDFTKMHKPQE